MKTVSRIPPGFPFQYKKYHPYHCGARSGNTLADVLSALAKFPPVSVPFLCLSSHPDGVRLRAPHRIHLWNN